VELLTIELSAFCWYFLSLGSHTLPSILKNAIFWDVTPCGHVRSYVQEKRDSSILWVERISEIETVLAVIAD
jgi:hypothetical protein